MQLKDIVVAVDFSEPSRVALERAAALARPSGATLHMLHAVPVVPYAAPAEFAMPASAWDHVEEEAARHLDEWAAEAEGRGLSVTRHTTRSAPVDAIHDRVRETGAQLIVMGTHGYSGLKHAFLGSVAERTLRTAEVPVLAAKGSLEEAREPIRRVLVASDFSPTATAAVDLAITWCRTLGAELNLIHAFFPAIPGYLELPAPVEAFQTLREGAEASLAKEDARIRETGLSGVSEVKDGGASRVIVDATAEHALDLVVIGTHGHTGLAHVFLGSVAERVVREARCSVLVVPKRAQTD